MSLSYHNTTCAPMRFHLKILINLINPQLFEKRPIWSRNAVKANINVHPEKMKHLLPYVAYYMVSRLTEKTLGLINLNIMWYSCQCVKIVKKIF